MRSWYTIRALAEGAELTIYDEIGACGVSAKAFLDAVGAIPDEQRITLRINSPGGSVFDAVAIHNALRRHPAGVTVWIDGIAASAASYIAMAGDDVVMPANAFLMIHDPSGMVLGTADDMRAMAEALEKIKTSLVAGYAGMALLGSAWPVPLAMAVAMACSFFVQSGEGAVYAIVPLVKKRVSGQISGLVGAYGNVGAVVFLTSLLYVSPSTFFLIIAGASVVGTVLVRWLPEPADSFAADLVGEVPDTAPAPGLVPVQLAPAGG